MSTKFKDLDIGEIFSMGVVGELSDLNRLFVKTPPKQMPFGMTNAACLESNKRFYLDPETECVNEN